MSAIHFLQCWFCCFSSPCLPVQLLQAWSQETSECWIGHSWSLESCQFCPQPSKKELMWSHPIQYFFQQTKPCLAALQFGKHVAWSKTAGLEIYCPFSWGWYVILVSAGFVIFSRTVYHTFLIKICSHLYTLINYRY